MLARLLVCAFLIASSSAFPKAKKPDPAPPTEFEIGRRTFFDFGPPFNYYDIFVVRSKAKGSSIERMTLSPAGASCMQPATVETASSQLAQSVPELLKDNPCAISKKALNRELKRCKKCLVFSGAVVEMQVRCGTQTRIIRSDILDRDIFDRTTKTPEHTSWTMNLLEQLDNSLPPGVMEKPIFSVEWDSQAPGKATTDSALLRDVTSGRYDKLFEGAAEKPSDLIRAAQKAIPQPDITIVTNPPLRPEVFVQPKYSPIARMANIDGAVTFSMQVDSTGKVTRLKIEAGHPMLVDSVVTAVSAWKYSPTAGNEQIYGTVTFASNCQKQ